MLIRLISISWNTSFVWFNDCMHWGGCSQLCSWISRTGYQQIMRYSSQNQLKPGHPLGYLVLSSLYYCFFTNAYFWGRAGLFEIICSYRLFPEPEFLCGLMWQSHWHNPSLDRYLTATFFEAGLGWYCWFRVGCIRWTCLPCLAATVWFCWFRSNRVAKNLEVFSTAEQHHEQPWTSCFSMSLGLRIRRTT